MPYPNYYNSENNQDSGSFDQWTKGLKKVNPKLQRKPFATKYRFGTLNSTMKVMFYSKNLLTTYNIMMNSRRTQSTMFVLNQSFILTDVHSRKSLRMAKTSEIQVGSWVEQSTNSLIIGTLGLKIPISSLVTIGWVDWMGATGR